MISSGLHVSSGIQNFFKTLHRRCFYGIPRALDSKNFFKTLFHRCYYGITGALQPRYFSQLFQNSPPLMLLEIS